MIKIFITGPPGVGKTTCVSRVYETLSVYGYRVSGFISKEIREDGRRVGFELVSIPEGVREILAHINYKDGPRIGKYIVNKKGFEEFLDKIFREEKEVDVYIIDEIGPMELTTPKFTEIVNKILESDKPAIMTIHITLSKEIHRRFKTDKPNVLYRITRDNRDAMPLIIWRELSRYLRER